MLAMAISCSKPVGCPQYLQIVVNAGAAQCGQDDESFFNIFFMITGFTTPFFIYSLLSVLYCIRISFFMQNTLSVMIRHKMFTQI